MLIFKVREYSSNNNITVKNITKNDPEKAFEAYKYRNNSYSYGCGCTTSVDSYLEKILGKKTVAKTAATEKNIEERVGSFVAIIDDLDYAQSLINRAQDLGLTVSGDGSLNVSRGASYAKEGNLLSFFGSKHFDIDWISDPSYSVRKNYIPVLKVRADYAEIVKRIKKAAEEKKELAKQKLPKTRVYRELKLADVADIERESLAKERKDKTTTVTTSCYNKTVVDILPHFLRVGNHVYVKNPNDNIVVW